MKENTHGYPEITLHDHPDAQYYLQLGREMRAAYLEGLLKQLGATILNLTKSAYHALMHHHKPALRV